MKRKADGKQLVMKEINISKVMLAFFNCKVTIVSTVLLASFEYR